VRRLNVRRLIVILSALLVGLWGFAPHAAHADSVANTALILGTSVSAHTATDGSARSLEQQQAEADGFTVTVVTAAQWTAMAAADFAKYQVIIIGDPNCNGPSGFAAAQANATVWQPVVMTSKGNKVLIGTDPTLHNNGPTGTRRGDLLENGGIAFAGAIKGATGAYVDTSCSYSTSTAPFVSAPPGTPVPIMDGLSTHGALQFTAGGAPCAGSISIVASTGPTSGLHDADLSNWSCSVHAFFDHFPSDWTVLALATDNTVPQVVSAKDIDTHLTVTGAPYILVAGEGITATSNVTLTPATDTNGLGTSHTVTATVCGDSVLTVAPCLAGTSPLPGVFVTFAIDSGPNVGASGTCSPMTCITDANGQVTFTYIGCKTAPPPCSGGTGTDGISATVTIGGVTQKGTATKTWIVIEQSISAQGTTFQAVEGQLFSGAVATFTDPTAASTAAEYTATIDWGDLSPTSPGTIIKGSDGTFTVNGTHTYVDEGTYSVLVTITDIDDATNGATANSTANVGDAALRAVCAAPANFTQSFSGATAIFTDANPGATVADFITVTIDWGDSSSSVGTVSGLTGGPFTVSGSHTYLTTGNFTIKTSITDDGGATATAFCNLLTFAFAPGGGSFVIGDKNAAVDTSVTFWGAQWSKDNSLSGGNAPASFKGFAENPTTPSCNVAWTTDPGNSTPPPDGPLPTFMAVIVTNSTAKDGSEISGNTVHIVIVQTNPGYAPDPGHSGTGKVVAMVC
jgi:hypothetical protein